MRALAVACLLATPAHADSFDPRDVDKQAHFAASYGITLTVTMIARHHDVARWKAALFGALATAIVGTTKELVDPPYSWGDQLANTLGSATAIGVVFAFSL